MKYTKTELIESIARHANDAETFLHAAESAYGELRRLNAIESASKVSTALLHLNELHQDEFHDEFHAAYCLEIELAYKNADDFDYSDIVKVRRALVVVNCIIKYGENYFKDEEGYL